MSADVTSIEVQAGLDVLQGRPAAVWREAEAWAAAEVARLKAKYRGRWDPEAAAAAAQPVGA